jgi:starvation-inducible DNA-binding protein
MKNTPSPLPAPARKQISEALRAVLTDGLDLYTQLKVAHWNIKGPHFAALHPLFDTVAPDQAANNDEVAERILTLGHLAVGIARHVAKNSRLPEYPQGTTKDLEHVALLAERIGAHLDGLRKELDGERLALARQAEETQALRAERDTLCDRAASAEAEVLALKGRLDDEDVQHRLTKNTLLAFDLQTKLVLSELEIAREEARTLNLAREEALQEVSAVRARMISVKALLDKDAKASQVWQAQAEEMRSKIEAANEDNAALHGTIDELRLALDEVRRGAKQSERVVNHLQGLLDRQRGSTVAAYAELERLKAELTASRNEAALLLGSVERLGGLNKIKTGMISTLSLIMVVLGVICVWL